MRLRLGVGARLSATIAGLCLVLVGCGWWQWSSMGRHLRDIRAEDQARAVDHLNGILELEAQPITTFVVSYSWWDELVAAIEHRDQAWLTANIDPALRDYQLDGALVLDAAGVPVHAVGQVALAPSAAELAELRRQHRLWSHDRQGGVLLDVAGSTIHPTADAEHRGEPRGFLLAWRRWRPERTSSIARLFGGDVSIATGTAGGSGQRVDTLEAVVPLAGVDGVVIASVHGERRVVALAAMQQQSRMYLGLSVLFGSVAVLALGAAGLLVIGRPLAELATAVQDHDIRRARHLADRGDELGLVASAVVRSIEQQADLSDEVAQRRQAEASVRAANEQLVGDLRRREDAERALREAEMRNALALQGGNLCIWEYVVADARWSIDRAWLSFLGITIDPALPETAAWESRIDGDGVRLVRDRLAHVCGGAAESLEVTFRVICDDGRRTWVLLRGMVVERGADGKAQRLAGTMLDVTRWRELEEQLRQSQKLESIGQLAAGIAHEINTPIQFIGDNTRFAAESLGALIALARQQAGLLATHPDESARAQAEEAARNTDFAYLEAEVPKAINETLEGVGRVATIVRAMKEFAHPGSPELVPTDLNHLVENAIVISRNTWRYVAELDVELDASMPLVPLAAGDFNQVLLNLIVNAAQAIEDAQQKMGKPSPGHIRVQTACMNDQAILKVSDDGCGIPDEVLGRIYDPFFTTKEVGRGSGQGLTIARAVVVERHRGRIACESTLQIGTAFTVTLPLALS